MEKDYDREYTIADVIKFKEGIEFTRKGLREDIKCRIMNGELEEIYSGEWERTDHSLKKLFDLRFKLIKKEREVEFLYAISQSNNGKTIRCKVNNKIYTYKPVKDNIKELIAKETHAGISVLEILNGKWYIEEE